MFKITENMAIVAGLVTFCSGQLCASDRTEMEIDKPSQVVPSINHLPEDALKLILAEVSKINHPITFCRVSKEWKGILDANSDISKPLLFEKQGLFMQQCMNVWWTERFKNGVLKFKPEGSEGLAFKFADLGNVFKGTFDLTSCEDIAQYLVITTDVERFFEIGGDNQSKVVILIALHQSIKKEIDAAARPFSSIMTGWDAAKAPVGIFWRWGNDASLSCFDNLTASSVASISSKNLYENWWLARRVRESSGRRGHTAIASREECLMFVF